MTHDTIEGTWQMQLIANSQDHIDALIESGIRFTDHVAPAEPRDLLAEDRKALGW